MSEFGIEPINNPNVYHNFWPNEPLSRDNYGEIDIIEAYNHIVEFRHPNNVKFWEQLGSPNELEKISNTNPIDVALYFVGYPNIDGVSPSKIMVFYTSGGWNAVVIVLREGVLADHLLHKEYRVDLYRNDGEWLIVWAGSRQVCRRTSSKEWTTELCP